MSENVAKKSPCHLLLVIVYLGYISLGLPDTVLGVAWPKMRLDLHQGVEWAGILATVTILGSAVSGFSSGLFINRVAAGTLLMISSFMTGGALLGYGLAPSFGVLLLLAIPLGLGGGCIDAAMNSFVARHYSSRHMSWLHGCWGVGATIGPALMTAMIASGAGWRWGYVLIAAIQLTMATLFLGTLRLWRDGGHPAAPVRTGDEDPAARRWRPWNDLSAWYSVLFFLFYTGVEFGVGLWGAVYLINCRGFSVEQAGYSLTLYWGALTAGRLVSGIFADRVGNRRMIAGGILVALVGVAGLWLTSDRVLLWGALIFCGGGLAPIYPCQMHETPRRFRPERANIVIGFQSGSACLGIAVLPSLAGWLGGCIGFAVLPGVLAAILLTLLTLLVLLNRRT